MTAGLDLSERYFTQVVQPLLADRWPRLRYAAARLGSGSDVLGLDDETSRDHDWGLRLTLMPPAEAVAQIDSLLERDLPADFEGHPVRFVVTWDPVVRQRTQVDSVSGFFASRLGLDPLAEISPAGWLGLSGQSVREVTAGRVFRDDDGTVRTARARLRWYPDDVWLLVLVATWRRLGDVLPTMGRLGQRGDRLGARMLASRFVTEAMRLGFLLERAWAPYPKWFGTYFRSLPRVGELETALSAVLATNDPKEREARVVDVLQALYGVQRDAGLPAEGRATEPFFDRPYIGIPESVTETLRAAITDPELRRPVKQITGAVEHWCTDDALMTDPAARMRLSETALRSS